MQALAKVCDVKMIVGNHDSFMKNTLDINSIKMFSDIDRVQIIDTPTEASINGNLSLLIPWLGDLSQFKNNRYDMLFGHFDISTKFLISQYVSSN